MTIPFEAIALLLDPEARFGLELGQYFDDYFIPMPKDEVFLEKKYNFYGQEVDNHIVEFNENVPIKKYNVVSAEDEYHIDYLDICRFYFFDTIKILLNKLNTEPKNHKGFFIEIKKNYHGVILPTGFQDNKIHDKVLISLKEKFFNLQVYDEYFSVILSFNNKLQQITIPYKAITLFFDPEFDFKIDLNFIDFIDDQLLDSNIKVVYAEF
jgi:hypothetical protein